LSGGTTTTTSIFEVVSPGREQLGHWKTWLIVSRATSVDRVHFMSIWHDGQAGGSNSSNARLILSTIPFAPCTSSIVSQALHISKIATVQMWTSRARRGHEEGAKKPPDFARLLLPAAADKR